MTDPLPGKRYGTLQAWPDPTDVATPATRWRYLALAPAPQRTPAGTPQVTMLEAGGMLMLTVGAMLGESEDSLDAARAAIAAEAGVEALSIDLRPAEASARQATLVLTTASGGAPRELAKATPSPIPPYPAAFSAMLRDDAAAEASAALKSGAGRMLVRYDVELAASRAVTARIEGEWDSDDDVETLLAAGRLTLVVEPDPGVSESLIAEARAEVMKAAREAMSTLSPPTECGGAAMARHRGVAASVTRTEPAPLSLSLEADVGEWL